MQKLSDILQLPSPLQKIQFPEWEQYGVEVFFKRDDLIHTAISGNKWRKLYGHLQKFEAGNYQGILTFGGAFSNHIVAVAAACRQLKIPSLGIIRGKTDENNPALKYAAECGMELLPISRTAYRNKELSELKIEYPEMNLDVYMEVPEGGGGAEGILGCKMITDEMTISYDYIVAACGTGTTVAGLAQYVPDHVQITGVSVLKGEDTLTDYIRTLTDKRNFEVISGYHFGGYARYTDELISFARDFTAKTDIPLDFVYTAKMVFAFADLLKKRFFPVGSRIILLHTGGLMNALIDESF